MSPTADDVVPWARSFAEYAESDLGSRILGCTSRPASAS